MGHAWITAINASAEATLVGIVDIDISAAEAAAAGLPDVATGTDVVAVAKESGADAIVDVTVPAAHHPITTAALFAGLPVLGEKPAADSVAKTLSLVAASQLTGKLFMISQSRRYNPQLVAFRSQARKLGDVGLLTTEFFRAPRFGGFRDRMAHPLLLDMSIHPFDTARYLLEAEPESVYCEEFNPSWSWFDGDAAATAVFRMTTGARYVYTGSWCSPGEETSWNGSWRLSAAGGFASWNGDDFPVSSPVLEVEPVEDPGDGIAGALHEFVGALRTGSVPMGEVRDNVRSLTMVEAAVQSAAVGLPVRIDDVLAQSHADAIRDETRPEVAEVLRSWPSVRDGLTA
jgi:predicted dehydrogenase